MGDIGWASRWRMCWHGYGWGYATHTYIDYILIFFADRCAGDKSNSIFAHVGGGAIPTSQKQSGGV